MPIIFVIVLLSALRYLEVGPFAALSWWWIAGLFVLAFVWFEFIERALGLDKRKEHKQAEKNRKDRIKRTLK
ncbi:MAG TPA: TIGR04438 family Trp-rich protein [Noviherbaspirillum sp.]|jgi:small Trp-rich protein|uniref:TIGR04438 family Trp-rich protein n=1 Tax=Noviherbaspirillum sp. TaxID=1926288 RepID=UPI002F91EC7D